MVKRVGTASSQSKLHTRTEGVCAFRAALSLANASESPRFAVFFAVVFPKEPKGVTPYYINREEPMSGGKWSQKLGNVLEIHSKSLIN